MLADIARCCYHCLDVGFPLPRNDMFNGITRGDRVHAFTVFVSISPWPSNCCLHFSASVHNSSNSPVNIIFLITLLCETDPFWTSAPRSFVAHSRNQMIDFIKTNNSFLLLSELALSNLTDISCLKWRQDGGIASPKRFHFLVVYFMVCGAT